MSKFIKACKYCNTIFDGTHGTPSPTKSGFKLITSQYIQDKTLNIADAYYISDADYFAINKRSKVKKWDILFSMIGTVGNIYLEKSDDIQYAIKNIGVFSCGEEGRAKWIYYYLQSSYAKSVISNYLNGAVQKFLPLGFLRVFPLSINSQV